MKKGNRASIRLTFHSRTSTPLSRSTEDLSQFMNESSADTLDTQSVDSREKSTESDSSQDKVDPISNKSVKGNKTAEEKRKQFGLTKFSIPSIKNSKTESFVPKNKAAIPLSKLLQESKATALNSNLTTSSKKSLQNLTWPKIAPLNLPKRKNIPTSWRQPTLQTTSCEPTKEEPAKRPNSQEKKIRIAEMRSTRDKFIIGFRSKSFPNLLKGTAKVVNCFSITVSFLFSETRILDKLNKSNWRLRFYVSICFLLSDTF